MLAKLSLENGSRDGVGSAKPSGDAAAEGEGCAGDVGEVSLFEGAVGCSFPKIYHTFSFLLIYFPEQEGEVDDEGKQLAN